MARVRTNRKRAQLARRIGRTERQVACGLETALWEAGPNPITDFADELQFEGKRKMPTGNFEQWQAIGKFRDALTAYLEGKNTAFIGGVAVRSYGGRTTPTIDFDVLIEPKLLNGITHLVEKEGGRLMGTVENTYSFHIKRAGFDLDIRVAKGPLDEAALAGAKSARFQGRKLKIVLPEYLTAMKVKAYSERKRDAQGKVDRSDVRGMLSVGATTEAEVRKILQKLRPDLLSEFAEILRA